jgi:hypothetical protein
MLCHVVGRGLCRLVDAVSRAEIDLQLRYPVSQIFVLTGIAINQAIDANQDSCSARAILQLVDPVAILICLFNAHAGSVAYGLRMSTRQKRLLNAA